MSKATAGSREGPEALGSFPQTLPKSTDNRPPSHLSPRSRADYVALNATHCFAPHELVTFVRALEWMDRSDALMREAEKLRGRERASRIKAAADASTVSLRFWRCLKFSDDNTPRRMGRPPGRRPWPVVTTTGDDGHADA